MHRLATLNDPVPQLTDETRAVLGSIPAWWAGRAQRAGLPSPWRDWRRALPAAPVELIRGTDALARASAYDLGCAYTTSLLSTDRLQHGCHYTPQVLAQALWKELRNVPSGRTEDPAAGAGALLLPAMRRRVRGLRSQSPQKALTTIANEFVGSDLDPCAVWLGNAILAAELLPIWAALPQAEREPLRPILHVRDGLEVRAGSLNAVTVLNPPYGRVRLDDAARQRWQHALYGHANLYALFLAAAIERTAPGGLVGAVIPTSFLGGAYYQRLRALLAERAPLERLLVVGERSGVFANGVQQETCLAVFRRASTHGRVICARQTVNGTVHRESLGRPRLPLNGYGHRPWLLPRSPEDRLLVRRAGRLTATLASYHWRVNTGPLVWNRHKPQISHERSAAAVPILWAADVSPERVAPAPARDAQRWIVLQARDDFMRLAEPAVLVQRTTTPEQPRRLIAGYLDAHTLERWGGVVVAENHVNVLRCTRSQGSLTPRVLVALLNSNTLDRLYRCLTGSVAVSAYELQALPFPPKATLHAWDRLADEQLAAVIERFYG